MTQAQSTISQPPASAPYWIVTDGAIGNEKQCEALVHYLARQADVFRVALRWPWRAFAPRGLVAARWAVTGTLANRLDGPWPRLLVTCGRRSALVSRLIRKLSGGRTKTAHILNPRISPRHFDAVICPRHDGLDGPNVIVTEGSLHCVDDAALARYRDAWPQLGQLPQPRVAVLIGASTSAVKIGQDYLEQLLERAALLAGDGSLLVSTSHRTPQSQRDFISRWFGQRSGLLWTGGAQNDNPYPGILGWADRLLVSADSVNMISEALGTGRPVHSQAPVGRNRRFARFHQRLAQSGRLLELDASDSVTDYPPLRETGAVAEQLRNLLQL